jgi:RNA polymerase sigma factor (sigma-70 family)
VRPYKLFLLTIAKNTVIDFIRKQPRDAISHACVDLENENLISEQMAKWANASVETDTTEEALHWRRCVEETERWVTTLDDMGQSYIQLRFKEELSQLAVARRLNISRGKARFLEKQLEKALKNHLEALNLAE